MNNLKPTETVLTGKWNLESGSVVADDTCIRISNLTKSYLIKIAQDKTGWEILYRDPSDSRYWELAYPHGELHGGGPPQLKCLTVEEAKTKYNF
jgi:hypothetical protein